MSTNRPRSPLHPTFAGAAIIAALLTAWIFAAGCTWEVACVADWDPATMRCARWCGGEIVERMLPSSDCVGRPTPAAVPEAS